MPKHTHVREKMTRMAFRLLDDELALNTCRAGEIGQTGCTEMPSKPEKNIEMPPKKFKFEFQKGFEVFVAKQWEDYSAFIRNKPSSHDA